MASSKRQTTMAKLTRERKVQERRQQKLEKKQEKKQAAADARSEAAADSTDGGSEVVEDLAST